MSERKKTSSNVPLLAGCVLVTALFIYAMYSYYWEFIPWENQNLILLYQVLAALAVGGMTGLALRANRKKRYSAAGLILRCVISMAVFVCALFGITYILNTVLDFGQSHTEFYASNEFAILAAYAVLSMMYGILLLLFFRRLSDKKLSHALGIFLLVVSCGVGAFLFRAVVPFQVLYPAYRLVKPQGGVETADAHIKYDFAWSTEKLYPTEDLGKDAKIGISLAKNEREGFQLVLAASEKGRSVTVSVEDFTNENGDTVPVRFYKERYTEVPSWGTFFSDEFPDALEPMDATTALTLGKHRLQPVYIEAVSGPDTPAGDYTAKVTVSAEDGTELLSADVTATVWDFELPETPAVETAVGIFSSEFWRLMGLDEATIYGHNGDDGSYSLDSEQSLIYKQYYDYLLNHHISPYELPYDILDDRADAYMSDPRVTSFCIPYPADDELLVKYYEKVTSNEEWAKKGYFYPIDEPNDADAYARYNEITDRLARLCPGYNMVTPFYSYETDIEGDDRSSVALQRGKSSILCPETIVLDAEGAPEELYAARDEADARLWWYVCCGPQGDYNNNFIRQDAIQHRLLFWQEKMAAFTGFLYWDSIYCDKGNPWETAKTWDNYSSAGDGCFLYPGRYAGYDEPVGTLRLVNLTDGIEDYAYLTMAEEKLGRDWVDERIAKITTSLTEYTGDDALLQDVRAEIGRALNVIA